MPNPAHPACASGDAVCAVLDFTSVMAGPSPRACWLICAEVIKIESLDGDQVRASPALREDAAPISATSTPARSLACNLGSGHPRPHPSDGARFDIVIENFRPGVMALRAGL
jgi:crotonobetainyl-CoA:carnitine CoA-transferase CaiB-like acyl-CoA transferase